MNQHSPARKVFTIVISLALAAVTLLVLTAGVVIINGTKANMTFTKMSTAPGSFKATTTIPPSTTTTAPAPTAQP